MNPPLTERQINILAYIKGHITVYQYPPTHREIQAALKISSLDVVARDLGALERKGYIERTPRIARGIRVV